MTAVDLSESLQAQVRRGAVLRREGSLDEAARVLRSVVEAPVTSSVARIEAYLELGKTYDRLGRRRSAQSCYRRILALTDDWTYREQARRLFRFRYQGS